MPIDTKFWAGFSGGWAPNDDAIKSNTPNSLLQMTNLVLDKNGALALQNGTTILRNVGDSAATNLFSKYLQGIRYDYLACTSGKVFRNATQLTAGGSTSRTAFSTAFDDTLICSGTYRVKDSGTGTPANLGIMAPTAGPNILNLLFKSLYLIPAASDVNGTSPAGATSVVGNITGTSYHALLEWQVDPTTLTFAFGTYNSAGPTDTTNLVQDQFGLTATTSDPNDFIVINPFAPNADSSSTVLNNITSIELQIWLTNPTGVSPVTAPTDYYDYLWTSDLAVNGDDIRLISGGNIILAPRRAQFTRIGANNALGWNTVVGYSLIINCATAMTGNAYMSFDTRFQGGHIGQLNGNIQYAQINVAQTSSYTALSTLGPVTIGSFVEAGAAILAQTPTDPQVTEVWIFRLDGGLDQWYRTMVIPVANVGTRQIDTSTNDDAITLGITVNLNLVSTASTGITDPILEIIGPIEGRWYYFTKSFLYPSDILDPDLVDVSEGIRICGSQSEVFLWAKKISESVVLVGTSIDVYVLQGTFQTLPDGTIDIYYRPISCAYPPISRDAVYFAGSIYYMSNMGWMSIVQGGQNQLLVSPVMDLLYQGESRYGYNGVALPGNAPGTVNFPCTVAKDKLWCVFTGSSGQIHVYDFVRQYWRPCIYGNLGDASAICVTQDGEILAYFADNNLRVIDDSTTKLLDGATNQTVQILSSAQVGETPRNRKDLSTFKSRCYTAGSNLSISIITDVGTVVLGNINSNTLNVENVLDASQKLAACKWWQFSLSGSLPDFLLQDCSLDMDIRPTPLTFLRGRNNNFTTGSKKRVRTWPFVIDTRGGIAIITPIVDNVAQAPIRVTSSEKTTILYKFITDVFGIDYGYTVFWDGATEFEFYEDMQPEIVQTLPIAKRFDQIGPVEFFRYGKVQKLDIRLYVNDTTNVLGFVLSLPYRIYFSDQLFLDLTLPVENMQEGSYTIGLPKGIAGSIFRLEIGPTNFDFHRYGIKILVNRSGTDTEGQWISLG